MNRWATFLIQNQDGHFPGRKYPFALRGLFYSLPSFSQSGPHFELEWGHPFAHSQQTQEILKRGPLIPLSSIQQSASTGILSMCCHKALYKWLQNGLYDLSGIEAPELRP